MLLRRIRSHRALPVLLAAAGVGIVAGVSLAFPDVSGGWRGVAVAEALVLVAVGRRLPGAVTDVLSVTGVGLVAFALVSSEMPHADLAALCAFPPLGAGAVLGRRGAARMMLIVLAVDVLLLAALARLGGPPRVVDVVFSACLLLCIIGVLEDRNHRLMAALSQEARIDALTGLPNRRGFAERAELVLAHLRREQRPCAVVMLDVDHFKAINDEWGHGAGDRVLRRVGEILQAGAREVDVVGRHGGEEFVSLLPGEDLAGARVFADRVRAAVAADFPTGPRVRLSAGVITGSADEDLPTLIAAADAAMYVAKRTGRDRTWVGADALVPG